MKTLLSSLAVLIALLSLPSPLRADDGTLVANQPAMVDTIYCQTEDDLKKIINETVKHGNAAGKEMFKTLSQEIQGNTPKCVGGPNIQVFILGKVGKKIDGFQRIDGSTVTVYIVKIYLLSKEVC